MGVEHLVGGTVGWLRSSIGLAIVILLASSAGQAMALAAIGAASFADAEDRPSWLVLVQNQLFDSPKNTSRGSMTSNQRSLLQNLLDLPGLTDRETRLFRETLQRNRRLSSAAEEELRRYLRQRIAELEREQERQRVEELEKQRLAELERRRQEERERQRQEELEKQRLAELERQRQEELEKQRLAELERQRQEESEPQRLEELEKQRLADLERQRLAKLEEEEAKAQAKPPPKQEALTELQRELLMHFLALTFISSVEKGMVQKLLDDNRLLSAVEEARLQQRYAGLQSILNPPKPVTNQTAEKEDVIASKPSPVQPAQDESLKSNSDKTDLLELLPRFKVEMPSPI